MNDIEKALQDQLLSDKFQKAVSDDFAFADSLIDQRDLDKFNDDGGKDQCQQ